MQALWILAWTMTRGGAAVRNSRTPPPTTLIGATILLVGDDERFEIPEAFLTGG